MAKYRITVVIQTLGEELGDIGAQATADFEDKDLALPNYEFVERFAEPATYAALDRFKSTR